MSAPRRSNSTNPRTGPGFPRVSAQPQRDRSNSNRQNYYNSESSGRSNNDYYNARPNNDSYNGNASPGRTGGERGQDGGYAGGGGGRSYSYNYGNMPGMNTAALGVNLGGFSPLGGIGLGGLSLGGLPMFGGRPGGTGIGLGTGGLDAGAGGFGMGGGRNGLFSNTREDFFGTSRIGGGIGIFGIGADEGSNAGPVNMGGFGGIMPGFSFVIPRDGAGVGAQPPTAPPR